MNLSSVTAQADAIRFDIQKLGPYEADVWFTETISRVPGSHNLSLFHPIPTTPLMQKVKDDQLTCVIGKSGNPKHYSGNEPPFVVAYPLMVKEDFLGVIQIARSDSQPFCREEIDLLDGLAANAAVALQVSHQTLIKNWRWEQLSLVRSVSEQIANVVGLDELCRKVAQLIHDTFNYYAVNIFTIDPGSEQLRFHACAGPVDVATGSTPVLAAQVGKGIVGVVANGGQEILANDVAREPRFMHVDELPLTRSEAVLPLKIEDRVLGVMDIQSDHIYAFHEMDMVVLRSLAASIALAVEGTHLYSALSRRVEQLSIVTEIGKALSTILDFDQLLEQIVEIISERFSYPFVHLYLVQKDTNQLVYRAGAGERSLVLDQTGLTYDIQDTMGIIPWVARNGATIIANDVALDPHYRPSTIHPNETVSEMAVPLIFGGEVLGVLDLQSAAVNRFDQDDRILFETLGDSLAIAIRNAFLFNAERWRRQASDSLREVAGLLPTNIALERLMDKILSELEGVLPCEAAAIWLVDDSRSDEDVPTLKLAAVHGVASSEIVDKCCHDPICMEWLEQALIPSEPTVRGANDPYGPLGLALNYTPEYSSIAAPMRVDHKPVGLITLAHSTPNRYGVESIQLTSAFANYAAVAIQNARLYSSAQEQAWIATILLQVAEATQSINVVDDLLSTVVRLTPMLLGISGCAFFLYEAEQEQFHLSAAHGIRFKGTPGEDEARIPAESVPALLEMVLRKSMVQISNPERHFALIETSEQIQQYVLVPLLSRGKVLGAYLVGFREGPSGSADKLSSILKGIAHQTAIAIENIHLLERQQQETYVSAVLLQVAQTVVSHANMDDVYAAIAPMIPMLVGSQVCFIYLWDEVETNYRLVQAVGVDRKTEEAMLHRPVSAEDARLLEYICVNNQSVIVPLDPVEQLDPQLWKDVNPQLAVDEGQVLRHPSPVLVGVPLGVKDDNYGAMLVVDSARQVEYFPKRMEIINGIGRQVSMAIQNDRLQLALLSQERLAREFQLAREIQQTFLPDELPEPEGWQVDARWRPAREVGGDFYDLFWIGNHQLAVVIADVSDKGISAALYMTLTRTILRTITQQKISPAHVLAKVNELLLRDTPHGMFITGLLGLIDQHTGKLVYANAGHNLPIIWREHTKSLETLQKGGMPLGIIENVNFVDHEIQLDHGDTILFYTDGITDTNSESDMFGEERLSDTIRQDATHTARSLLLTIDQALMDFQGSMQPADDVTALAIHRK